MRQIEQEIIQATNKLKKNVDLTTEIITGNENTVVEVNPGSTVRSPKKMIEDCYQETQKVIEKKFGSLDQAIQKSLNYSNAAKKSENNAKTSETAAASSASAASASETNATGLANTAAQNAASVQADKAAVTSLRNEVESDRAEVANNKALVLGYRDEAKTARDEARQAAATVTGVITEAGNFDASSNRLPAKPGASTFWKITSAGTLDGVDYGVGDSLVYSKNSDSFYKIDNTESVTSVNGKHGVVTLSALDVGALPTSTSVTDLGGYAKATIDSFLANKSDNHSHPYRRNDWVPTFAQVTSKPSTYPPSSHNHNGLYYSKTEVDALLLALSNRLAAVEAKLANVTVSGTKTIFSGEIKVKDVEVND